MNPDFGMNPNEFMRAYFDVMNTNPLLAQQFAEAIRRNNPQAQPTPAYDNTPQRPADTPLPDTDSDDDELERKPEKLSECMLFTGEQLHEWHNFKFFIVGRIERSLHRRHRGGRKALHIISDALRGSAATYYRAKYPFRNPDHFFASFERDHKIRSMYEMSMQKLDEIQWKGDIRLYTNEFMSLQVWCNGMDAYTLLNKFIIPLPSAYREFFITHRAGATTWQEASALLFDWQQDKARFNGRSANVPPPRTSLPGPSPSSNSNSSTSGPVPMDINAAQAGGASSNKQYPTPSAVFWADKICKACGKMGHGVTYRGCPKHPQYNPRPAKPASGHRTYAAAVSAAVGGHSSPVASPPPPATPAAAPTATPAAATASTSTAAANASTSAAAATNDNAEMRAQMANITAMLQALVGNN
jgi:hypothetical protein